MLRLMVAFHAMDWLTTFAGVTWLGLTETNPEVVSLIAAGRWDIFAARKALYLLYIAALSVPIVPLAQWAGLAAATAKLLYRLCLLIPTAVIAGVLIWNAAGILAK